MSPWHLVVLVLVGLFVFGPERLPTLIRDLGKALRQVRSTAQSMQEDLKAELGPEVGDLDLRSLHPRTFVEKHLFGDEEDPLGLNGLHKDITEPLISFDKPAAVPAPVSAESNGRTSLRKDEALRASESNGSGTAAASANPARWDADAT